MIKSDPGPRRCLDCAKGHVYPVAKKGRLVAVADGNVELPESLVILTCDTCGSYRLDKSVSAAITKAVESATRKPPRKYVAVRN